MQHQTAHTRFWWWISLLLIALFIKPLSAAATDLPDGVTQVHHFGGITEYRLDSNGLTVLLAPDQSSGSVTVNMTYLVGSRHENYGQTGMAHLLEHMLFKGTPTMRNALGEFSRRGLSANGTTWDDRTNYYATFTANPEHLDWYLRWQADVMVNASILQEDLDAEMTVVRNEMERNENSPGSVLTSKMTSAAYQWHNYGNSVIGARSDVENVDIEQLREFYRTYYQPDNAVLVVAGKFDPQQTLAVIADAFSSIERPTRTLPREYTVEPVQDGTRRVTLNRSGGTPLVATLYHIAQGTHPDYPALMMATSILADTPSGPLYKALVPTGEASSVFGFSSSRHGPHTAIFGADLKSDQDPEGVLNIINDVIENISKEPFTQEALDRQKQRYINSWTETYNDMAQVGIALTETIALGDWRYFFQRRDAVANVTLEEVQAAAEKYFVPANRTEGLYIPTDKPVRAPAYEAIDITAALESYDVPADSADQALFDSSPANIDAMTQRKVLNLPTGTVKLALLPKPTRGDRVSGLLTVNFGNVDQLRGKAVIAKLTAMLLQGGTAHHDRQGISDRLNELNMELSMAETGVGVEAAFTTREEYVPEALDLIFELLKEPIFPQGELEEAVAAGISSIQSAMADPQSLAGRTLSRHDQPYDSDDLRYTATSEELLERFAAVKRDDLVEFHETFYGNGEVNFTLVGQFKPEIVEESLASHLGSWKRAPAYTRLSEPYYEVSPGVITVETPDKANAMFLAGHPIKLQDTDPDYPAAYIANYLFGQMHSSRMWTRIRDKEGLSYGVGSGLNASSIEPSGSWRLYAIYAPENQEKLRTAFLEEYERAKNEGFTQAELDDAKTSFTNRAALARSSDGNVASLWSQFLADNRTFAWQQDFEDKVNELTLDDVNEAFRKYMKADQLVEVYAGDFAAHAGKEAADSSNKGADKAKNGTPKDESADK